MPAPWSVTVFGPAYIDRVLRVTEPIALEGHRPIDISIQAISLTTAPGNGLDINAPHGNSLKIVVPEGWPGPWGTIQLQEDPWPTCQHNALRKVVNALAWNEDLGGMGAGYARALGGRLIFAIGQPDDPISDQILKKLTKNEIRCTPVRISAKSADWTLLVTSGAYGDKLAIGFRGYDSKGLDCRTSKCNSRTIDFIGEGSWINARNDRCGANDRVSTTAVGSRRPFNSSRITESVRNAMPGHPFGSLRLHGRMRYYFAAPNRR